MSNEITLKKLCEKIQGLVDIGYGEIKVKTDTTPEQVIITMKNIPLVKRNEDGTYTEAFEKGIAEYYENWEEMQWLKKDLK